LTCSDHQRMVKPDFALSRGLSGGYYELAEWLT